MSFDNSRFSFDPTRDYFGVVMQQGRVQLDADWNEWLAQLSRRLQAGTIDLVGRSGVPATTPSAFKINAFVDLVTETPHITIGAGRMYVDGLLVENHGPANPGSQWDPALAELSAAPSLPNTTEVDLDYTQQPYLLGGTLSAAQVAGKQFLVYLDVWQRDITALQDAGLIEPAIGIDTTGRRQTVWQVKLLDVTGLSFSAAAPDAPLPGRLNPDPALQPWMNVIQPSGGLLTTGTGGVQTTAPSACALSPANGYTGLENQLYRVEIHQAATATAAATFKWSRENASVATLVSAITTLATNGASQLTVQSLGRDQVLGFRPGDWIEVIDDVLELNGQSGELHLITTVDPHGKTITLDGPVSSTNFPLTGGLTTPSRHTRVLRWDQAGAVYFSDGNSTITSLDTTGSAGVPVPPAGTSLILEAGITVAFDLAASGGAFLPGDFWTFAARTADNSVQILNRAASQGVHHHYARLATVAFAAQVASVDFASQVPSVVDTRRGFPSLGNPAIHITSVFSGGTPLPNDATLTIQSLANNGISVVCDAPLDPASVTHPNLLNCPICFVTLDLPSAANGGAFTRLTLPSAVTVGPPNPPNTLQWKPPASSVASMISQVPLTGPPILARLTLKGRGIWAAANPNIFLNGTGDGRSAADYELWFWLISQPIATLQVNSLMFDVPQLVPIAGAPPVAPPASAVKTITVFNNSTAGTLAINKIAINPANLGFSQNNFGAPALPMQIPAATAAGPGSGTLSVTFIPTSIGQVTATLSIVEGADGDANPLIVTLTGTGIQPSLAASAKSLVFAANTIVNTTSPGQPITLTCSGSQVSINSFNFVPAAGAAFVFNEFSLSNLPPVPFLMSPGDISQFQVFFNPTVAGANNVQLSIAHTAPGSPLLIPLSGTGVPGTPVITPSVTALPLSGVLPGSSSSRVLTIINTGNALLTISGVSRTGSTAFSFTSGCSSLQPGQPCTINVTFTPPNAGTFAGVLQIVHNASPTPLSIALSGVGLAKNTIQEKVIRDTPPTKSVVLRLATEAGRPVMEIDPIALQGVEHLAATAHAAFITPEERPALTPHVATEGQPGPEGPEETSPDEPKPE